MQRMGPGCFHRYLCSFGSVRVFSARGCLGTAARYSPRGFPQVAAQTLLKIDLFPGLIAGSVWAGQPLDPGPPVAVGLWGCYCVSAPGHGGRGARELHRPSSDLLPIKCFNH